MKKPFVSPEFRQLILLPDDDFCHGADCVLAELLLAGSLWWAPSPSSWGPAPSG